MEQLLLHLWGDYITQSHWMATHKMKDRWPAAFHSVVYSLPFLFIGSWHAVMVIGVTHYFIDHYRLARYVVYAKNLVFGDWRRHASYQPLEHTWTDCSATGYSQDVPPWLAVWLLIIADNTLHLTINYFALKFL